MYQYIACQDGDYWIINTEKPITYNDLINDKNAILMTCSYLFELYCMVGENRVADNDHFIGIKKKFIDELREYIDNNPKFEQSSNFNKPLQLFEELTRINDYNEIPLKLRIAIFKQKYNYLDFSGQKYPNDSCTVCIMDPNKVGLGEDEQYIHSPLYEELNKIETDFETDLINFIMQKGPYDHSSYKYENRKLIEEQMEIIKQEIYNEIEQLILNKEFDITSNILKDYNKISEKLFNEKKHKLKIFMKENNINDYDKFQDLSIHTMIVGVYNELKSKFKNNNEKNNEKEKEPEH